MPTMLALADDTRTHYLLILEPTASLTQMVRLARSRGHHPLGDHHSAGEHAGGLRRARRRSGSGSGVEQRAARELSGPRRRGNRGAGSSRATTFF
jgi:hypothetical protein